MIDNPLPSDPADPGNSGLPDTPLVERALVMATRAHAGRVRKGGSEPEITHPVAVARIVAHHGYGDVAIAAALLHDVVEDTDLEPEDLRAEFPEGVCRIVADLTEDRIEGPRSETWERRKASKLARLESAGESSLAVCAADRIHNMESVIAMLAERGADALAPFSRPPAEMLAYERRIAGRVRQGLAHPIVDRLERTLEDFRRALLEKGGPEIEPRD